MVVFTAALQAVATAELCFDCMEVWEARKLRKSSVEMDHRVGLGQNAAPSGSVAATTTASAQSGSVRRPGYASEMA